jgi:Bacterial Ig domain
MTSRPGVARRAGVVLALAAVLVAGPARLAAAQSSPPPPSPAVPAAGPSLRGDDLVVAGSAQLGIDVLRNDDAGSAPLDPATLGVAVPPGHGTAVVEGDHTLSYTPAKGYEGSDSFAYRVCDTGGACAEASVFVSHDASEPYVAAGYGITAAVLGGYAVRTLRRGRKLSPQVAPERRRWM